MNSLCKCSNVDILPNKHFDIFSLTLLYFFFFSFFFFSPFTVECRSAEYYLFYLMLILITFKKNITLFLVSAQKITQKTNELLLHNGIGGWFRNFAKEETEISERNKNKKNPSKEEGKTSKVKLNKIKKIPPRIIPRSHTTKNGISIQLPLFILFICNLFYTILNVFSL